MVKHINILLFYFSLFKFYINGKNISLNLNINHKDNDFYNLEIKINNEKKYFLISTTLNKNILFSDEDKNDYNNVFKIPFYNKNIFKGKIYKNNIEINENFILNEIEFIEINKNDFFNKILNFNNNINGILSFSRINLKDEDYNENLILSKLYDKKIIDSFSLKFNFNSNNLLIGSIDSLFSEEFITNCMLYNNDKDIYDKFSCKSFYIIFNTDNFDSNEENLYLKNTFYILFEPLINNIIFPLSILNEFIEKLLTKNYENFCEIKELNFEDIKYLICLKSEIKKIIQNIYFYIILNGFGYKINGENIFIEYDENYYKLDILFIENNNYIVLGKIFLNNLNEIIYNINNKKIYFFNKNIPINFNISYDKKENNNYLIYALILLIFIILFAILIPYFFYRRFKKKMLDRLIYDIEYKKVEEIKNNLLQNNY